MGNQDQFQVARIRALPLQMVNTKCLGRLEKQSGFGHISFLYPLELAQNQIAELLRQSSRVRDRLQFGPATSLWGDLVQVTNLSEPQLLHLQNRNWILSVLHKLWGFRETNHVQSLAIVPGMLYKLNKCFLLIISFINWPFFKRLPTLDPLPDIPQPIPPCSTSTQSHDCYAIL